METPVQIALTSPITDAERISLIDVLRGFALFGVLLANLIPDFSGSSLVLADNPGQLSNFWLDRLTQLGLEFFIHRKFVTLFTFLFGLGFAVQLARAEKRAAKAWPLYLKRLGILFILGTLHAFLLWYGDILHWYALLGLGILLFYRRKEKTVLIGGIVLALVIPLLMVNLGALFSPLPPPPSATPIPHTGPKMESILLQAFSQGSYADVLQSNWAYYEHKYLNPFVGLFLMLTLGNMLMGFWAGRRRLFHDYPQHLTLFRRLLWRGLAVGSAGCTAMVVGRLFEPVIPFNSLAFCIMMSLSLIGAPAMTIGYVSALVLLYHHSSRWRSRLSRLAPVGRMALTNYLMQTLVWSWVFYGYGLGLMGKIGPAFALLLGLMLYTAQLLFSTWWLRRFQFGPMEWLWRSLTYGQRQPMRARKVISETTPNNTDQPAEAKIPLSTL